MVRIALAILALGIAASAVPAQAQQSVIPQKAQPAPRAYQPPSAFGNRVSPFGRDGLFPSHRFVSELVAAEFSRQASYAHTPEVDAANAASILIDRGDCAGAEALLRGKGEAAMAARVAPTCEAKRRGLI